MIRSLCLVFLICAGAGCTNMSHQRITVGQSTTLDHIYRQQVADNLAKFTNDPHALPHFSFPSEGGTSINDTAGISSGFNFDPFGLTDYGLTPSAQRGLNVSWIMEPVSDPAKLGRMRALYQQAAANPWYSHGVKSDVPKRNTCLVVGHFCGTYIWVSPDCGSEQLTNLTLAILDAALNDPPEVVPPVPPTKIVEKLTEKDKDGNTLKTSIKETYEELVDTSNKAAVPLTPQNVLVPKASTRQPGTGTGALRVRQALDFLAPPTRRR